MSRRWLWLGLAVIVVAVGVVVAVSLALVPQETNPAFAAALEFAQAAGQGDDAAAFARLSPDLQRYVAANCPEGRVSACIQDYIPPEWGKFLGVVFRRAAPDGPNWNVDLIATYEKDRGFSGVCIYQRMEADAAGAWRVARWAGYVACGDPASRNMAVNPDAPNQAP